MKRASLGLLFVTALLSSCAGETVYDFKYELSVNNLLGDIVLSLPKPGIYEAGTKLYFELAFVTDIGYFAYFNDIRTNMTREESSKEFVLRYYVWMPEFDATLTLTSDMFYGKDDYYLPNIAHVPVKAEVDDVEKVRFETISYDGSQNTLSDILYTSDEDDISSSLSFIDQYVTKQNGHHEDEHTGTRIRWDLKEGYSFDIGFQSNCYVWIDFNDSRHFKLSKDFPKISSPSLHAHRFASLIDGRYEVYKNDGNTLLGTYDSLGNLEFIELDSYDETEPEYVIKPYFMDKDIYVLSSEIIKFDDTVYRLNTELGFELPFYPN